MILFDFFKCDQDELLNSFCEYFDLSIAHAKKYFDTCDLNNINTIDVIKGLSIDLSKCENKEAFCVGCHLTTTTQDGIDPFRQKGILNLAQMLSHV